MPSVLEFVIRPEEAHLASSLPAPGDDYGDVLLNGVHWPDAPTGELAIGLVGPLRRGVLFPVGLSMPVVTARVRRQLERALLDWLAFERVVVARAVRIEWSDGSDDPPFIPESGDPADYVLAGQHDEVLAGEIGPVWALGSLHQCTWDSDRGLYVAVESAPAYTCSTSGQLVCRASAADGLATVLGSELTFQVMSRLDEDSGADEQLPDRVGAPRHPCPPTAGHYLLRHPDGAIETAHVWRSRSSGVLVAVAPGGVEETLHVEDPAFRGLVWEGPFESDDAALWAMFQYNTQGDV